MLVIKKLHQTVYHLVLSQEKNWLPAQVPAEESNGFITNVVCYVISVLEKTVVVNKQMVNVATGLFLKMYTK